MNLTKGIYFYRYGDPCVLLSSDNDEVGYIVLTDFEYYSSLFSNRDFLNYGKFELITDIFSCGTE